MGAVQEEYKVDYIMETVGLRKSYKGNVVVNDVNIHVPKGAIYGFVGPNGAGKSTVMKMILNLIQPEAGEVQLFGEKVTDQSYEVFKRVGSIIENPYFYEKMTARQNLELHCDYMGFPNKERIDEVLQMVDLQNVEGKQIRHYSLGMKQRLAIARAMQIFVSLTSWDGLSELTLFSDFSGFMDRFYVGIENYKEILTSKEFYQVIGNTLEFVILYIPLMLIASMIVALILNSHVKGVGIFRVLYYIPVITSWVAGALIWKWVLSPEYGAINNILALFGIEGPSWLQSSKWAMPAIVLASVWKDMGYFGLMLMSGLQGINQEYYDAAAIDGAGKIKQFTRITLPLLTPTLFFVLIISLINSFQLFTQIMIMTPDGGPLGSTMVMVERIYKCGFRYYEMGTAAAYSWILFAILLLLTMVQMKLQNKWVNYDD